MPSESWAGPLGEARAASTAGGGTALTTTAQCIQIPPGTAHLSMEGRNYSTAVVVQYALNPYLIVLVTPDLLATVTDYSEAAQDGSVSTDVVLSSLDTLAAGDAVYLGSHLPFRGVMVDVDAANANASVLSGDYWNGSAWSALTVTDNSASAGATFAQGGAITWTLPTDWAPGALRNLVSTCGTNVREATNGGMYWARLKVSAALDSSTTLNSLLSLSRSTAYAELVSGRVLEIAMNRGAGGLGNIEAKTDAGTANLIINAWSRYGRGFTS